MKKALKRHGTHTDGLRSYRAAMTGLGNAEKQELGRWVNNWVDNSHLPFRGRERAMLSFREIKSLQEFASVYANVHYHSTYNAISSIDKLISPAAWLP